MFECEAVIMDRVILHSDLNNFYASVECLYNPQLRDKPVAVAGAQASRHGIILAKNYIAKAAGVKTGEAIWEAKSKCPGLVIVSPNYYLYLTFSRKARAIYERYTNQVEPYGIDESWLDVTGSTLLFGSGEKIAHEIKDAIKDELGITASVGVSYNKIFAKLASDMQKPDAVTVVTGDDYRDKVWKLPVEDLLYVGPATQKKLNRVAIRTIGDLANAQPLFLKKYLGVWGQYLYAFANGYDDAPVHAAGFDSIIKSIGNSMTTPRDLRTNEDVKVLIYALADSVGERLRKHNLKGSTIQISIKDNELKFMEKQAPLLRPTYTTVDIAQKAYEIFLKGWNWSKSIRALGVRAVNLSTADTGIQLSFLEDESRRIKKEILDHSIDKIRGRFGHYSVQRALMLLDADLNIDPVEESVVLPAPYFK